MQETTIAILARWGEMIQDQITTDSADLATVLAQAEAENPWFTEAFQRQALSYWAHHLKSAPLSEWLANYTLPTNPPKKQVALILAGNIPLVGFHDLLCVLIAGLQCQVKLSGQDRRLLPHLVDLLGSEFPEWSQRVTFTSDRLSSFQAVIATGSNNTSRYFEYYFKDVPRIIRKNRHSVAVLNGNETEQELRGLISDMLDYFGLGCRSVSKIWAPKGYDFTDLSKLLQEEDHFLQHNKFGNNFHYHRTIFLMNQINFLEFGPLIFLEKEPSASALSTIHYQYYESMDEVLVSLEAEQDELQCVLGSPSNFQKSSIQVQPLGSSQKPALNAYADNVDTVNFLLSL